MARPHPSNGSSKKDRIPPPKHLGGNDSGKGVTKTGNPRQRGVRTYYALAGDGSLIRFDDYHTRESAIRDGHARRVSAHEAREIESRGTLAVPLSTRLTRTPVLPPGVAANAAATGMRVDDAGGGYDVGGTTMVGADRRLIEVYTLLGRVAADLGQIQGLLGSMMQGGGR